MWQDHPILLAAYLVVGPGMWLALFIGFPFAYSRMNRLKKQPAPQLPTELPRVTILVPAKDEEQRISNCIERVLEQDYAAFDVIAIDDRSKDRTGVILDELSQAHDNLRVVHVPGGGLPNGWLGKCHALSQGSALARGEWLLFVDSDVILSPEALARTLAVALARTYDAISILTRLECQSFWEQLILPLAAGTWSIMNFVSLTNDDQSKTALANGQFFLVRRAAYEKVGGHATVRNQITEDVELMRLLKSSGFIVRLFLGSHLAATRMHSTLRQMFHGWGRIFSGTSRRRPWRILTAAIFIISSGFSAYLALALGLWTWHDTRHPELLVIATIHLVLLTTYLSMIYQFSENPKRYAWLFPLSGSVMLAIFAYALRMCQTGRLIWRDTNYGEDLHGPASSSQQSGSIPSPSGRGLG